MILSLTPSWLPSLCQPADWLVARILVILLVTVIVALMANAETEKGGDNIG